MAACLLSSFYNKPLPDQALFFGEIGLTGEVRRVNQAEKRLKEAKKLGFKHAFVPKSPEDKTTNTIGLEIKRISHVRDLLSLFNT